MLWYWMMEMPLVLHISLFFMSNDSCDMNLGNSQTIMLICFLSRRSSRRLQDVFKIFQDFFKKSCKNVFKTYSKRFQYILKTWNEDKKWSFPLRIFSVNVTKFTVFRGFGHIYWRNCLWKTSFFVQCGLKRSFWLTKVLETEFLQKSNTAGNDSYVHQFDQNFMNEKGKFAVGTVNKSRLKVNF